jgi:hypothetical protein
LNAGYSHLALAQQVASSPEAAIHFVANAYVRYLGRNVDAASLQLSVDSLLRGGRDDQLIAGILGSDEYFQRAQAGA